MMLHVGMLVIWALGAILYAGSHGKVLSAGKELMTEETIEHMASVVEAKGTDAFWQAPIEELLPESLKSEAPKLEKRLETMDVWFDSGTSWAGCVEGTDGLSFPADLYLEVSKGGILPWSKSVPVKECAWQDSWREFANAGPKLRFSLMPLR